MCKVPSWSDLTLRRAISIAMLMGSCREEAAIEGGDTQGAQTSGGAHDTSSGSGHATLMADVTGGSGTGPNGEVTTGEIRGSSTSEDPFTGSDTEETDTSAANECSFSESFEGLVDGSDWPSPWVASGGVLLADVQAGRGRLVPVSSGYSLARMFVPLSCVNAEGTFTFELSDGATQGVGFYLRQNGYLQQTEPPGEGYASFSQSFTTPTGISLWREVDGHEMILAPYTAKMIVPGVTYAVRFRVTQDGPATTRLQTRLWPASELEPGHWDIDLTDDTPSLQGLEGGLAIDAWSQLTAGMPSDLFVDDIVVMATR